MDRVKVVNFTQWGKLVKTWATGTNYFQDGNAYPPPTTRQQLIDQLALAQVFLAEPLPAWIVNVRCVQPDNQTLLIRLPHAEMIRESEASLTSGSGYSLPGFYSPVFNNLNPTIPQGAKLDFHAARIGDYTISGCQ